MLQTNKYMLMFFTAFLSTQLSGAVQDDSSYEANYESLKSTQGCRNDDNSSYQQTSQDTQLDNVSTLLDAGDFNQPQLVNEPMEYQRPTNEADINTSTDGSFSELVRSMYIE